MGGVHVISTAGEDSSPIVIQSSPREVFFSIGDAKDIRMVSHMLIASALVVDEGLLHLTAFPNLSD